MIDVFLARKPDVSHLSSNVVLKRCLVMNAGHFSSKSMKSMSHLSKSWSIHPIRLAADADRVEVEFVDEVADDGRKRTAAADC